MVRQMLKGITMTMLLLALSIVTASVSAQGSHSEYANIPFDFVTGDTRDDCRTISSASRMTSNGDAICVRGTENSQSAIKLSNNLVRTNPATNQAGISPLRKYLLLSEVWIRVKAPVVRSESRMQKAVERELVASRKRYENVTVALARD